MVVASFVSLFAACTSSGDDSGPVDTTPVDTDDSSPPPVEPVWNDLHIETSSTFNGVYVSVDGVYVGGTGGTVLSGGTGGAWTDISPEVAGTDIGDLWGTGTGAELVLVAGAGSGNIAWYAGGAWTVDDVGTASSEGVGGSSAGSVFAVTFGGIYWRSGDTWTFETAPGNPRLNDVFAIGEDAVAVGEGGVVSIRSKGVWASGDSGTSTDLAGVSGSSMNDLWAVGGAGLAIHWDGSTWTTTDTGTQQALWAVWAATPSAVYAVGSGGTAIRWTGAAWEDLPTGIDNNLYSVGGTGADNVYAGGNRGALVRFTGP